jgi:hypothetical protein
VQTATGSFASVGKMAQSPEQMEAAGILKPGSAVLIASLVSQGKTVEEAMTDNLFTGMPGAENLQAYIASTTAQIKAQVANFQQAQTQLTNSGVMTGNEDASQVTGPINAVMGTGLKTTVDFLKTSSSANGFGISGDVNTAVGATNKVLGDVKSLVSSGNYAANMATKMTGGLTSLTTSLDGLKKTVGGGVSGLLDSAKGIAAGAFAAITKGFPSLKAGVPQNLKQIADKASSDIQSAGTNASDVASIVKSAASTSGIDVAAIASGKASSAINGLDSINTAVATAVGSTTNVVTALENAESAVSATLPASVASGLNNLPGAQNAVSTVIKGGVSAVNLVPGVTGIKNSIKDITASVTTGSGAANALVNQLKLPGASLLQKAGLGLSPAALTLLENSIAQISSEGGTQIKPPTVGTSTDNTRPALASQLQNLFNNAKIQVPNYGGNPATTGETAGTAALDKVSERSAKIKELGAQSDQQRLAVGRANIAYATAVAELPAGDPGIEAAAEKVRQERLALIDIIDQMKKLFA